MQKIQNLKYRNQKDRDKALDLEEEDNLEVAREEVFKEVIEVDFKIKVKEVDFKIKVTEVNKETIVLEDEDNNNLFDKYNHV